MGKLDTEIKKRGRGRPKKTDEPILPPPPPVQQRAIGIDIGVDGFHVCVPRDDMRITEWPVYFITYLSINWREQLLAMLAPNTVVTAEPTGWHYLMPVARVITQESPAQLWLVDHSATKSWRETSGMLQKTDMNDARTLAAIADKVYYTHEAAGAHLLDWNEQEELLELRFMMNSYHKINKEMNRHKNRISHLGHSIDPRLNVGVAWYRFMEHGAFAPDEIIAFNFQGRGIHHKTAIAMKELQSALRPTNVSPMLYTAIYENYLAYTSLETQQSQILNDLIERIQSSKWAWLYDLWLTVPGAGEAAVIATIIASKGRPQELPFKVFRATVGMYPVLKYSGNKKQAKSARRGYRPAMAMIHMWVQSLIKETAPDNLVRRYFAGGTKLGGRKYSATKARFLRILHGIAKSGTPYDPTKGKEPPRTVEHGPNPHKERLRLYAEYTASLNAAIEDGDIMLAASILTDMQSAGLIKPPDTLGSDPDNPPPPNGTRPKHPNGSRRPMSNGKLIDAPPGLDSVPLGEDAPPPKRGRPPKR